MLILSDADGLRVNFDQLCERVFQPAGDGYRRAQIDIKIRKFLCGELGCGVNRSACLTDNHILNRQTAFADKLRQKLFGFAACRAVAQCDTGDMVFLTQALHGLLGFRNRLFGHGRINDSGIQNRAGLIDNGQLAAHAVAGVKAEHDMVFNRRLHEQRTQIERKGCDRLFVCRVGQFLANFAAERREQQTLPSILCHFGQLLFIRMRLAEYGAANQLQCRFVITDEFHFEQLFAFAAVEREHLMALDAANGAGKCAVFLIYGLFHFLAGGNQLTGVANQCAQMAAQRRIDRAVFSENIHGAG